jgi:hypothetical protein
MELFIIAAFIGLCFAAPILIPQLRENMRQRKRLRLGLIILVPTLVYLLAMGIQIDFAIRHSLYWGCKMSYPPEDRWNYSICNDDAVKSQFQSEYLFQMMLPPMFRADEICLTAEAGSFCETIATPHDWEDYFYLFPLSVTAGLSCFAILWFFSRDIRKAKNGGETTP